MSENAKKTRKRKGPSAEERLREATASCEGSYRQWQNIYENGCMDPSWPDGVNLNLVHNHIHYYKKIIQECSDELGLEYPEVYFRDIPPKVDTDYIAQPERIIKDAQEAYQELSEHPSYKKLLAMKSQYSPRQLEKIFYPAVVGYVRNLKEFIARNDLVSMRRYRNWKRYIESFEECLKRAEDLEPEEFQLTLFDMTA